MVLAGILLVVILAGIMIVIHKSKPEEPKEEITFEEISQAPESSESTEETTEESTEEVSYPAPEYDFITEEVTVPIKGLDREYTLVWVSDLHLVSDHEAGDENGDVRPEYLDAIRKDTKNWLLQKMVYMPKTCGRRLSNSLTMVTMMVQSLVEI